MKVLAIAQEVLGEFFLLIRPHRYWMSYYVAIILRLLTSSSWKMVANGTATSHINRVDL